MTRRYILDTNALGDLVYKRKGIPGKVQEARRAGFRVGTCPPILGELLYGAEYSQSRENNLRLIRIGIRGLTVWPFDQVAAEEYGRLAAELRRRGRPMQIPDIQLTAVALTLGNCTVVSSDSDLLAVPGLSVENWAA
jgi:tRNA(fMet)-specific endonuclease VapC